MIFDPEKITDEQLREIYLMLFKYDKNKCLPTILMKFYNEMTPLLTNMKYFEKKFYLQPNIVIREFLRQFCTLLKFFHPIEEQLDVPISRQLFTELKEIIVEEEKE